MSNPATGLAGDEVLSVLEAAFRAGLLEIKRIRAAKEPEPLPTRPKPGRKDAPQSRTSNAIDILTQATRPLYIQEILEQLEQRGLPATRDSLVSALTKVIAPAGRVVRVAPNTFTVKGRYALLKLAAMKAFGPTRTDDYHELPPWRSHRDREGLRKPSANDLLTRLRADLAAQVHAKPPDGALHPRETFAAA